MVRALYLAALLPASTAAADTPAAAMRFDCSVALMTPQRQLTASTPVAISFTLEKGVLRDIHVVDTGGILYPGGNIHLVKKADAIAMEAVAIPSERPGDWSGRAEKKMYRLTLKSGVQTNAAEIGIGRTVAKGTGRVGLVWNAINQPEGLPEPITGSGVGNCAIVTKDSQ